MASRTETPDRQVKTSSNNDTSGVPARTLSDGKLGRLLGNAADLHRPLHRTTPAAPATKGRPRPV